MDALSSDNKRIAVNTFFLYIRMLLMMVVSLYTSRIVLDALGVVDFGLYNVVGGIVVALGFLSGTLNTASSRFITVALSKGCLDEMKKTFSNVLFVNILLAVIVLIAGETVGLWFLYNKLQVPPERFNAAFWVYQMSIVTVMINIISSAYNACIIAHEKMKAFAYFSLFDCFAKLLIAYALFITNYDKLIIYGALLLTVQIIDRIVYGAYCTRKFNETRTKIILDRPLLTQMFKFISWASYGSFVSIGFTQGLNILINLFFGPAINAARAVSVQVQNAIKGFCINFQTALNPQITKSYASGDMLYMHNLVFTSSKFSYFLLLFISLPVMFETDLILQWWLKVVPAHTVVFVRLILVISMIDSLANPLIQAASATGKIRKYQSVVGTMLIMILPISYIALKCGSTPESVFIIQFIVFCVALFARVWMLRTLVNLSLSEYFRKALLPMFLVTVFSLVIPMVIRVCMLQSLSRFVTVCVVSFISVVVSVYIFGLVDKERAFFVDRLKTLRNKFRQ